VWDLFSEERSLFEGMNDGPFPAFDDKNGDVQSRRNSVALDGRKTPFRLRRPERTTNGDGSIVVNDKAISADVYCGAGL
jgi:hypothetical protein